MNDNKVEKENHVVGVMRRFDSAIKAVGWAEEQILATNIVAPSERTINIASNYVAYLVESLLHLEDLARGKQELLAEEKINIRGIDNPLLTHDPEEIHNFRMEGESALYPAQKGDYVALKKYLAKLGVRNKGAGEKRGGTYLAQRGEELARRLFTLAKILPDRSEEHSFSPPIPSWMDPRFAESESE